MRYNDATMVEWPGAVRARRDNVPGRGVTMRVVSSVTRILVYIVIIILGVLALVAPYALEYYEFGASTQSDLEAISIAMGSEFFTHALLPVGLFGCLSNIVALVFLSGKRKDKRYGKFVGETLAGIVVNIGRFIMALTVAICSRSFYFIGQSYLKMLTTERVGVGNVTFEPGCRNNWHIHHKGGQILLVTGGRGWYQEWGKKGGQILLVTGGRGWYQEWGKEAQELKAGDVVNIPPEVKHWHGAAPDSWFQHLAIEVPAEGASNEWLEEVSDEEYGKLK